MTDQDEDTVETLPAFGLRKAGRARRFGLPSALLLLWATAAVVDIVFFHLGPGLGQPAAVKAASVPSAAAHGHSAPSASSHPAAANNLSVLAPVSAVAYGPGGTSSGDNPQYAHLAIDSSTATAWSTNWYTTARFGNLQTGTGLLIYMGRRVEITSIEIILGSTPGADLQVLTGAEPAMAGMRLQASATDAGGALQLALARPERARYLLIWFTLLPRDSSGTFQASIYNVMLEGTP